ncbi:MAG TPA: OsmC family protein [Longimicrobiales bacterium]|nr:OsmC family protein [Longimicrobiales bacterium]
MKIVLQGEDAILLSATEGTLTIEADSPEQSYSPFHMLGSALAYCTFSVLYSWASNSDHDVSDLQVRVSWEFTDNPHRVGSMKMELQWPSLPATRKAAAERAAQLCAIHATLSHTVPITTELSA